MDGDKVVARIAPLADVLAKEGRWWSKQFDLLDARLYGLLFRLYPLVLVLIIVITMVSLPRFVLRPTGADLVAPVIGSFAGALLACASVTLLCSLAVSAFVHGLTGVPFGRSTRMLLRETHAVLASAAAVSGRTAVGVLLCTPGAVWLETRSPSVEREGVSQAKLIALTQVGFAVVLVSIVAIYLAMRSMLRLLTDLPPLSRHLVSILTPSGVAGVMASRSDSVTARVLELWYPSVVNGVPRADVVEDVVRSLPNFDGWICFGLCAVSLWTVAWLQREHRAVAAEVGAGGPAPARSPVSR